SFLFPRPLVLQPLAPRRGRLAVQRQADAHLPALAQHRHVHRLAGAGVPQGTLHVEAVGHRQPADGQDHVALLHAGGGHLRGAAAATTTRRGPLPSRTCSRQLRPWLTPATFRALRCVASTRLTVSALMAKAMAWASSRRATLMPMTAPRMSRSGPPELPGLIA